MADVADIADQLEGQLLEAQAVDDALGRKVALQLVVSAIDGAMVRFPLASELWYLKGATELELAAIDEIGRAAGETAGTAALRRALDLDPTMGAARLLLAENLYSSRLIDDSAKILGGFGDGLSEMTPWRRTAVLALDASTSMQCEDWSRARRAVEGLAGEFSDPEAYRAELLPDPIDVLGLLASLEWADHSLDPLREPTVALASALRRSVGLAPKTAVALDRLDLTIGPASEPEP